MTPRGARVVLTHALPGEGPALLRDAGCELIIIEAPDHRVDRPESMLIGPLRDAQALLSLVSVPVRASLLAHAPKLRVIANVGVGFDNIEVAAATERGILVTNTPEVLTDATAELAWALIFAAARRLGEGERLLRSGGFHGWRIDMMLGMGLRGRSLGVLGAGRIGRRVAEIGVALGLSALAWTRSPDREWARRFGVTFVDFDTLLSDSDVISVNVSAGADTHHLIDRRALSLMRPHALIVNTARGSVIDEAALADALRQGRIGGAGLDVYEDEPRVHPDLLSAPNAVLLPHLGSATRETRAAMAHLACRNVLAALSGERPPTPVNPEPWPLR